MKEYILFLDIDGVVNTLQYSPVYKRITYHHPDDNTVNNRTAIEWLNEVYKNFKFKIVFISSWNHFLNTEQLMTIMYNSGLNREIVAYSNNKLKYETKEQVIKEWLRHHTTKDIAPCILEDENICEDKVLRSCLITCRADVGITAIEKHSIETMFQWWTNHKFKLSKED